MNLENTEPNSVGKREGVPTDPIPVQRLGPKGTDAIMERTVTYDYSEIVPLFLKTFIGGGEAFVTNEKLTFSWQQRKLEVEVTNETGKGQIK